MARSGCRLSKSLSEPDHSLSIYGNETTQNWPCKRSKCVLLPCSNVLPDIFAVMNCAVLALSAVFCSGLLTWSVDDLYLFQWHIVQRVKRVCRLICMSRQQTSPKCWFANVNITSYCDVTNSVYPVTMTTIHHCSILEFGRRHKIKQSHWTSPYLCTPLGTTNSAKQTIDCGVTQQTKITVQ